VVIVGAKCNGEEGALTTRSVDNSIVWLPGLGHQCVSEAPTRTGAIMAKRKKGSKAQSRAKLRRANSAKRGKPRKAAKAKAAARAKPKRAPVKKAKRKVKQPVAPVVETVAVEVIELPADAIIVTEVEQTEIRKAS
jgi:hypothetical protein